MSEDHAERGEGSALERPLNEDPDEHVHYSQRAPWLRAYVLGANDGLVSVAALLMGIGGGSDSYKTMVLSGVAGLVGGALSMAVGEYISVSAQRDTEEADVEKEREQQRKGPDSQRREFEELVRIYIDRGCSERTARAVATDLSVKDVIRAHARDELGIDVDAMANPLQAAGASAIAFAFGAAIPLLSGVFVNDPTIRVIAIAVGTTVGLIVFGGIGAALGGAHQLRGAARVLIGGWMALGITYGIGRALGAHIA